MDFVEQILTFFNENAGLLSLISVIAAVLAALFAFMQARAASKANKIAEQAAAFAEEANQIARDANGYGSQSLEISKEANALSREANDYTRRSYERELGRGFVEFNLVLVPLHPETGQPRDNVKNMWSSSPKWQLQLTNRGVGNAFRVQLAVTAFDRSSSYTAPELRGGETKVWDLDDELQNRLDYYLQEKTDLFDDPLPWQLDDFVTTLHWKDFEGTDRGPLSQDKIHLAFTNHPRYREIIEHIIK